MDRLPSPPYNVVPNVLGARNEDPPRLVVFRYYDYPAGRRLGDEAWVTGSEVDDLLRSGHLIEIQSVNTRPVLSGEAVAPAAPPAPVESEEALVGTLFSTPDDDGDDDDEDEDEDDE